MNWIKRHWRALLLTLTGVTWLLLAIWSGGGLSPWGFVQSLWFLVNGRLAEAGAVLWPAAYAQRGVSPAQLAYFLFTGRGTELGAAIAQGGVFAAVLLNIAAFALGLLLIRLLLSAPFVPVAVARVVVRQALAGKVTLVAVAAVLALPLLTFAVATDQPVRYQIQWFLSWSQMGLWLLLGLLTIFLGCFSTAHEFKTGQATVLFAKPVARLSYLVGKFAGLAVLNALLYGIAGASIYTTAAFGIGRQRPYDDLDAYAIEEQVLVARAVVDASPADSEVVTAVQSFMRTIKPIQPNDPGYPVEPEFRTAEATSAAVQRFRTALGFPADMPPDQFKIIAAVSDVAGRLGRLKREKPDYALNAQTGDVRDDIQIATELAVEFLGGWRTIPSGTNRAFVFKGIDRAAALAMSSRTDEAGNPRGSFQLRYKLSLAPPPTNRQAGIFLTIGGRLINPTVSDDQGRSYYVPIAIAVDTVQAIPYPLDLVEPDGTLIVVLGNPPAQAANANEPSPVTSLTVDPEKGLQVMYRVGGFGPNLLRSLLLDFLRLLFIAMLAVISGTFLSFPIATVFTATFWTLATLSAGVLDALNYIPEGQRANQAITLYDYTLRPIIQFMATILVRFGNSSGTDAVSDGTLVPWSLVGSTALYIGIGWTLLCLLAGWILFSRREIARVQI